MKKITYIEFNKLKPSIENPRLSPMLLERNHYDPFKAYLEYFKSETYSIICARYKPLLRRIPQVEGISRYILSLISIEFPLDFYKLASRVDPLGIYKVPHIVPPLVVYKENDSFIIYDGNIRYFGLYYLLDDNMPDFYSKDIKDTLSKFDKSQLPKELPCHIYEDIKQVYHITHMLNTKGE